MAADEIVFDGGEYVEILPGSDAAFLGRCLAERMRERMQHEQGKHGSLECVEWTIERISDQLHSRLKLARQSAPSVAP